MGRCLALSGPLLPLALAACIPGTGQRDPVAQPPPQTVRQPLAEDVTALPSPPPAWEARRVAPDARAVSPTSYIVAAGDTLRGIAAKTGAGSEAIARANGLAPPFTIFAGQRLAIPGGRYHLVRGGQTGIAIARAYGVDWGRIVTANMLEEPFILRTGQRVLIPGEAIPRSAAERAQAFRLDIDDIITGGEPALAANTAPTRPSASSKRILPSTAAVAEPARLRGGFQWPVEGRVVRRFGPGASGERNDGIKIAVPLQTPVLAAADGVVAYVGSDIPALGGLVILRHGDGLTSVYGHAGDLLVQRGQSVKRGQRIALSGDSGAADRPELHFELRQGRTPVDPLSRLPARS
ncbi:peptidoglycan DD-metalloendopeptidase family protein [Sphingomonas sp. S1-29]|uniref:peptidoglycan DD-metalloendopeptidase family protein n=1 Tax=Sphingomonas sp. S1-29 TaxID=2991074 RepID=UPI00223FC8ED|nr:peptidoglycan DD-metalloendopeptidase family protein [Sphingomonas sp. S1-29]UZK69890.1 peptidoglycan DD-metalloendopeptidase family protein [Sphingomonas sp. S1-29]